MIDKIKSTIQQAGEVIKEQASNLNDSVKEKGFRLIEDWVGALPKMEENGLEITSFSIGISINPVLEVELKGKHEDFTQEAIEVALEEHSTNTPFTLVFNTIKTTYTLHEKAKCSMNDPLIVKIYVKISPEIKVFIGEPIIM